MGIEVVEQFVEGKSEGRLCEDLIVVTDDFAAVIDGASDATGAQFDGKNGGRLAAEVVAAAISTLPTDADARVFADTLTAALAAAVGDLPGDVRWPVAVVACASAQRREVWRIGDCRVAIGEVQHPSNFKVGATSNAFRAAVNAALLAKGTPLHEVLESDPGAKAARQLIDIQQHLANNVGPFGYGCINGKLVPDEYVEVYPIPDDATEVIFSSDGYTVLLQTLRETEEALAQLIRSDPAAIDEFWSVGKSTKPGSNGPDDRSYLRFIVE